MVSFNFIGIFRPRCDLNMQFSELYSYSQTLFSILNHEHIEWSACGPCKADVVLAKSTLSLQSRRFPCKVDVLRTKLSLSLQSWRCSYKVVVVLCTKLMLFAQSFVQRNKKIGKLILIKTASYICVCLRSFWVSLWTLTSKVREWAFSFS